MIRYLRFFVSPVVMFLIAFAMFFGGIWLWLPGLCYVFGIALLDHFFPLDLDEEDYRAPLLLDVALYLSTPAALAMFFSLFWVAGTGAGDALGAGAWIQSLTGTDVVALRNQTPWYHFVLMFPAIAVPITGAGGLAGHELTHRTWKPFDLWLGRATMAFNWGIAFPIEHVYGHHSYVGTKKDPATAARGDSLYAHLPKAMYRTVVNAWEIESARLDKLDASFFSPRNVLLRLGIIALAMTVVAYVLSKVIVGWVSASKKSGERRRLSRGSFPVSMRATSTETLPHLNQVPEARPGAGRRSGGMRRSLAFSRPGT